MITKAPEARSRLASAPARPVPADAVHVWRGYRAAATSPQKFVDFLGQVFVPACALLQPRAGLSAYLPALPARTLTPAAGPDQTALMFWTSQQSYTDAFATPAVRAYTNLHGDVYGPPSSAQFPVPFTGEVTVEQPYHLFAGPVDWMLGHVWHLVGGRPPDVPGALFQAAVGAWVRDYQADPPSDVDAALICVGQDYLAFWQHRPAANGAASGGAGAAPADDGGCPPGLAALVVAYLDAPATTVSLPGGLWDAWPGLDLRGAACLNIQLDRPHEPGPTAPREDR